MMSSKLRGLRVFLFGILSLIAVYSMEAVCEPATDDNDVVPMQHQHPLHFAFVDVAVILSYLPSLANLTAVRNIESASTLFLDQGLNVIPTTVFVVRVSVISQTVNRNRTTYMSNSTDRTSIYGITTVLEIAIECQLGCVDEGLRNVEARIRNLFESEWEDLCDLLIVLDEWYFGLLVSVSLQPKEKPSAPLNSTDNSDRVNNSSDDGSYSTPVWAISVVVVVGLWVMMSILAMIPLARRIARNRRKRTEKGMFGSSSSNSGTNTASEGDEGDISVQAPIDDSSSNIESLYLRDVPDDGTCGRSIFSEGIVQSQSGLADLKTKKLTAEERLMATFTVYKDSAGNHKIETAFTPKSGADIWKHNFESQIDMLRKRRRVNNDRINEKKLQQLCNLSALGVSSGSDVEDSGDSIKEEEQSYWIESGTKSGGDDSISALTGVPCNGDDNEDEELDVLSAEGATANEISGKSGCKHPLPLSYLAPSLQKEYF
jgi:hypothetical protein